MTTVTNVPNITTTTKVNICEPPIKLMIMGESRVGKTAIVNKVTANGCDGYTHTQDVNVHQITNHNNQYITIWDCSGNRKCNLVHRHIRRATGVILVCNLHISFTQKCLWFWYNKVMTVAPNAKITVLVNVVGSSRPINDEYLVQFLNEYPTVDVQVLNIKHASPSVLVDLVSCASQY